MQLSIEREPTFAPVPVLRCLAEPRAPVTPAGFAAMAERFGFGYRFIYLGMCSVLVAVGEVLGDTLARHDRRDREKSGEVAAT